MFEAVTSYPGGLRPLEFRFDLAYAAEDALRSLASALTTGSPGVRLNNRKPVEPTAMSKTPVRINLRST